MWVKYQNQNLSVDHIDFINQLPIHLTKKIKGLEFSICHNLPTNMYGGDLSPEQCQENFDQLFAENKCDVAIYAHIHHQLMRYSSDGRLIINPGSIGQPYFKWKKQCSDFDLIPFWNKIIDILPVFFTPGLRYISTHDALASLSSNMPRQSHLYLLACEKSSPICQYFKLKIV